jgi:hypothetical protein
MLPKSFDPDALRNVGLFALATLVIGGFLVLRFVTKMALRVVLLGLFIGLAVGVWLERDYLRDCVPECDCSIAGFDVQVPDCPDTN